MEHTHARRRRAGQHGVERSRLVGRAVGDGRQGRARQRRSPATSSPRRPRNCYLRSEAGLVAAIGVEDLVVVATDDAVMVAPRNRTQEVKQLVGRLLAEKRDEADALPTVHRPWGTYRSLHNGHRVQVKHIMVRPGGKLSLQMHHHRAEHWVVVQGTAKIVRGNEEMILTEDQSTYIPLGTAAPAGKPRQDPAAPDRGAIAAAISAKTTSSASRTATGRSSREIIKNPLPLGEGG